MAKKRIKGSTPVVKKGTRVVGDTDPNQVIRVTVALQGPHKDDEDLHRHLRESPHEHLSHDEFTVRYGAADANIELVKTFAEEHGLKVEKTSKAFRTVTLSGTAADFGKAFDVLLKNHEHDDRPGEHFHAHEGDLAIPEELHDIVVGIFGLSGRKLVDPKRAGDKDEAKPKAAAEPADKGRKEMIPPRDIAGNYYSFNEDLTGKGQSIALLQFGGGYCDGDLDRYFKELNLPRPEITTNLKTQPAACDGGGGGRPGVFCNDMEVYMDLEIVGSIAPGADIHVHFADSDENGILEGLQALLENPVYDVVTISWNFPEYEFSAKFQEFIVYPFSKAAAHGATVCVASGDRGPYALPWENRKAVNVFAASPYALTCGGTQLEKKGKEEREVVWNEWDTLVDGIEFCKKVECRKLENEMPLCHVARKPLQFASGGGESAEDRVKRPPYQSQVGQLKDDSPTEAGDAQWKGRLVPDVGGYASGFPGYKAFLHGLYFGVGGTSAVAPLYAALIALLNEKLVKSGKKPAGYLNRRLYELGKQKNNGVLNSITTGDTKIDGVGYTAGPGWDMCTGWGAVNFDKLLEFLMSHQASQADTPK